MMVASNLPLIALISLSLASQQEILLEKNLTPFSKKFGQLVNETLELWHVPGLSIGVVDGDDIWTEGYGIASYPSTPVTPSTLFYAGSTTKAFVSAAISLLVDNSTLEWTTPISSIIPSDFVLKDEYFTAHLTLEDALSHRTGMPRHDFSYGGHYDGHKATAKDIVRSLRYLPLTAELRTKWQYCNMMYQVISHVIETLTGRWLGDVLKEKIWTPLGMNSTKENNEPNQYFSTPAAKAAPEDLAQGYVYYKEKYQEVPYMDLVETSGAGSVISNVLDYTKWLHALILEAGPLSKAGHKAVRAPRIFMESPEDLPFTGNLGYALGWETGIYHNYQFFEHSGGMEAFSTEIIFFPSLSYGLISFGNTAGTSFCAEQRLIWYLIDEKLGIPESERFNWNQQNKKKAKEEAEQYKNALQIFYPNIPNPPLPHTVPLSHYEGTYFHPAYHSLTLALKDGRLHIDRDDATWKIVCDLEHVSGEYFMAYIDSSTAPGSVFKHAAPAEFRIASDGTPNAFGVMAEPQMGIEGRIWFDRI
ncbi:hypothetical protein B7494_g4491 [Chlorociboria aeruginascens]|nr:hypothetical protein B7494_g4491 [Chlorociboria aeruginascens]